MLSVDSKRLSDEDVETIQKILKFINQTHKEFERIYNTEAWEKVKNELEENEKPRIIPSNSISLAKLGRCEFLAFSKRRLHMQYGRYYTVSDTKFFKQGRNQSKKQDAGVWFDRFLKYKLSKSEFKDLLEFDVELKKEFEGVLFYSRIDIVINLSDNKKIGLEIKNGRIWDSDEVVLNFYKLFFDYVIVYSPFIYKKVLNREQIDNRVRVDLMFDDDCNVILHRRDEESEIYLEYFEDYAKRIQSLDSPVFLNLSFCRFCELGRSGKCPAQNLHNALDSYESKQFELKNKRNELKFKHFLKREARNELLLSLI